MEQQPHPLKDENVALVHNTCLLVAIENGKRMYDLHLPHFLKYRGWSWLLSVMLTGRTSQSKTIISSGDNIQDHIPVDVGQAIVTAIESISQLFVIYSQ